MTEKVNSEWAICDNVQVRRREGGSERLKKRKRTVSGRIGGRELIRRTRRQRQ